VPKEPFSYPKLRDMVVLSTGIWLVSAKPKEIVNTAIPRKIKQQKESNKTNRMSRKAKAKMRTILRMAYITSITKLMTIILISIS